MYCPSCGANNPDGSAFCQECGGKLTSATPPPPQGAPPPPYNPPPPQAAPPQYTPPPPQGSQTSPPGSGVNLDIGGWLSQAINEVASDLGSYIVLALVTGILSSILGILAGPMLAGSLKVVRRKLRNEGKVDISLALNKGFGVFVPAFLLVFLSFVVLFIVMLILSLLPGIGWLLAIIVALAAMGGLLPFYAISLHYVTEEKMDFQPAATNAINIIMANPMMYWVFGLVTSIVIGIGGFVFGIGSLFTIPVGLVMMSLMLNRMFPEK